MDNETTSTRYEWVADWGEPVEGDAQEARLCEAAAEWLSKHGPEDVEIVDVRPPRAGEIRALYEVTRNGGLQILGSTVDVPEDVEHLTNRAWEAAWEAESRGDRDEATDGTLHDYATGEDLRPATAAEAAASREAARSDGGSGVIQVAGRSCYVAD